jgi:hypothetical protein
VPAVLDNVFCSSCAGRHRLCYPHEDAIYGNRDYEFRCPVTNLPASVPKHEWCEPTTSCPKDAIFVREVRR